MSNANRFVIVVGIDYSELADRALDQALEVASLREGAELHVLHVGREVSVAAFFESSALIGSLPPSTNDADTEVRRVRQRAAEGVSRIPAHLDRARIQRVVAHFMRGFPAECIAQLAADLDADLVVVGSHGHRGLERLLLGSVAERVVRLARCPVWVVRPKDHANGAQAPQIEPPCADCLEVRQQSNGATFWCARHAEHHPRAHRYSYNSDGIYSAETAGYEATPERGA